eukprot:893039-Alexandrium_andersonii.AAC.1
MARRLPDGSRERHLGRNDQVTHGPEYGRGGDGVSDMVKRCAGTQACAGPRPGSAGTTTTWTSV